MLDTPARQRLANLLTLGCMVATAVVATLAILAAMGGLDAEIFFGYISFLFLLFIAAPANLLLAPVAVYNACRTGRHWANAWIFGYFTLWFATAVIAIMTSGIFEPFRDSVAQFVEDTRQPADAELRELLRRQDPLDPAGLETLAQLIEAGADVNGRDNYMGFPYLSHVARLGDAEATRMLLEAGADPSTVIDTQYGFGGRHSVEIEQPNMLVAAGFSSRGDRLKTLRLLIDAGAIPDGRGLLGTCIRDDLASYRYLVDAGAPLDAHDKKENSCLHFAASEGNVDIMVLLLEQGTSPNLRNSFSQTPLDLAVKYEQAPAIRLLLQTGGTAKQQDKLLILAARAPEVFDAIAATPGFDASFMAGDAFQELMRKCEARSLRQLLRLGANPDTTNNKGIPPLHLLARSTCTNRQEMLDAFLAAGANLEIRRRGETAVAAAAHSQSPDFLQMLLAAGADIDARVSKPDLAPTDTDPTILDNLAGSLSTAEACIILVQAGATLNARTREKLESIARRYPKLAHLKVLLDSLPPDPGE